jgi:site-specific DNA recombinase
VPVGSRPRPEPALHGHGVDPRHRDDHPGQSPVHRPPGLEPAAHRLPARRPANTSLGHKSVQRWNLPDGWVISARPAHPALVSEADFIAAQDINAARGPAAHTDMPVPEQRRYLLAGLLACGDCGRRMESAWSNGKAAYRCRHGHTSAAPSDRGRPKNAHIREDRILPHLPALFLLLTGTKPTDGRRRRTRRGADARPWAGAEDVIGYLRDRRITLTYNPAEGTLQADTAKTTIRKAS